MKRITTYLPEGGKRRRAMGIGQMHRVDREVVDSAQIEQIVASCDVVRVGFVDEDGLPYIVPMNFGHETVDGKLVLYVHGALSGKKWDLVGGGVRVSFEMDCGHELVDGRFACDYSYRYASVMGRGTISEVKGEEKVHGLKVMMGAFGYPGICEFSRGSLSRTRVARLTVESVSAKAHR